MIKNKHLSLSHLQQGILFHCLYEEDKGLYLEQIVGDLKEKIDIDIFFEQSWREVIKRHDILRTHFIWENLDNPQQIVNETIDFKVNIEDYSNLSLEEKQQKFENFLREDRDKGFDFKQAPLMRLSLFKLEEFNYKMLWTFHHILLDGRSFTLLLQEIFDIYEAKLNQEKLTLHEPIPYQNYLNWLEEQDLKKAQYFWQKQFTNFVAPTSLKSLKFDKLKTNNHKNATESIVFSKELTQKLHQFVKENNLTLNTLIQGAWALLLSRYSNEKNIIFGAVRACRHSVKNAELMIGLLINTVPIRIIVSPEQNVLVYLNNIRQNWLEIRDFEYTPLAKIQQWSNLPSNVPFFESLLVFENYQLNKYLRQQGNQWKKRHFELFEKGNYPLNIGAYDGDKLCLKIGYKTELFDQSIISKMLEHLQILLEEFINNPQEKLGSLSILTESEKQQILIDWNNTKADYPRDKCIHQLFEEQVIKTPNNIAISFKNKQLTYQELNEKANQLAHYLQKLGVKTETLVGICIERSLEMIIGILGILKAGGAYVPLDPNYPQERLKFMLEDSQISILLIQEKLINILEFKFKNIVKLDADWQFIQQESKNNTTKVVQSHNLAYVIYTSGSTGKPKGVMIEHQGVVNTIYFRITKQFQPEDLANLPFFISISFDASVAQIFSILAAGGKITILNDMGEIDKLSKYEKFTILITTPSILETYLNAFELPNSLRVLGTSGELINQNLLNKINKYTHIKKCIIYGPTETSIFCTYYAF